MRQNRSTVIASAKGVLISSSFSLGLDPRVHAIVAREGGCPDQVRAKGRRRAHIPHVIPAQAGIQQRAVLPAK